MTLMTHQKITRAIGGTVYVTIVRDPANGELKYVVSYANRGGLQPWLSKHHFPDIAQAEAGCLALSDFLGARYRA
ncbi:hypothetical protein [Bradyrhizobium sp. JYMT SZCCT0428]|uniref:hypothetical protein n=1 Tax=Bradyrhizobium sp. JYMT SZCCT0428 TaxID=2807673 RepID=UPI001BA66E7D|nr:hypothetical protein [Bradyrhizobium sp. JYMT SZCCT0428]MBR1154179.1 hypothetical protein [Bradyrhizobium sp. JYMT SZCCT0428]